VFYGFIACKSTKVVGVFVQIFVRRFSYLSLRLRG
jgi:hypothetical protein